MLTGGAKDTIPPKAISFSPKNFSKNVKDNVIRISFDELIRIENVSKNVIISPPLKKMPKINPVSSPRDYISVELDVDSLKKNTTYIINFIKAIKDNNESNLLPELKYVFSTGDNIDSLTVKGTVQYSNKKDLPKDVTVMLYPIDENYTDSILYKELPTYMTNTRDSNYFEITNIKEGLYKLIALKSKSQQIKYSLKNDSIGFVVNTLKLPQDTSTFFKLNLFKELDTFDIQRPIHASKGKIQLLFKGTPRDIDVKRISPVKNDSIRDLFIRSFTGDTIDYWFEREEQDSITFEISRNKIPIDTVSVDLKRQKEQDFTINPNIKGTLHITEKLSFKTNKPIYAINDSCISIVDKDSISIPLHLEINKLKDQVAILFDTQEKQEYKLELLPGAIESIFKERNDTINTSFRTISKIDYGSIKITLNKIPEKNIIIELMDGNKVIRRASCKNGEKTYLFEYLQPKHYSFRIIVDDNDNDRWDTGNHVKNLLPEEIIYYKDSITVKSNWDIEEKWDLF
ncbi:hypothetical protein JBKA6_1257 [Ichthyobacterium seriolicida]|uniref:SbsA Ig-like domain-containing protein n=2 Tax=Ichthyobacterium seriolicida TaxID=242600 RepID=A0A1J1E7G8_9FLAO|nr:hypothetical protein JBKA6_1257 [Ichthyobacterium seriolicida]